MRRALLQCAEARDKRRARAQKQDECRRSEVSGMAVPKNALEGIRVIALGRYQAEPHIGLVLARLGVEVIKV